MSERGNNGVVDNSRVFDIDLTYALRLDLRAQIEPWKMEEAPFEEWVVTASLNLHAEDEDDEATLSMLSAAGLPLELGRGARTLVPLYCGRDLVSELDARDADSLQLASYLFEGDHLTDKAEEACDDALGGAVLLMDHFALHPAWQGLGLGPLISLATMRTLALGRDIRLAALHAAPPLSPEVRTPGVDRRAIAGKIRAAWERAGFEVLNKTSEGWIMIAPALGDSTWPTELWPGLLNEVNAAVNTRVAESVERRSA